MSWMEQMIILSLCRIVLLSEMIIVAIGRALSELRAIDDFCICGYFLGRFHKNRRRNPGNRSNLYEYAQLLLVEFNSSTHGRTKISSCEWRIVFCVGLLVQLCAQVCVFSCYLCDGSRK